MVVDTSALLAVLQDEPERTSFIGAIEGANGCWISVASFVEASVLIDTRYGNEGIRDLDHFLAVARFELYGVDDNQAYVARQAYRDFGKGRHPAALNFGDCFAYALARYLGDELLFKGTDFSKTDVECHPASR